MSETTTPPVAALPAAPPPPAPLAAPIIAAPPPPPKVDEGEVRMTSAQLKARLDEERAKGERAREAALADSLGVDIETAKRLIADAKAKDDAAKSEVQRLTEQLAAEKARNAEFANYKAAVEAQATTEMAGLNDTQRAAVEALAGNDPAARLRTIATLRPTWAAAQKAAEDAAAAQAAAKAEADRIAAENAAKAAAEAAKKAPIPAGATTTPAAPPPPAATPGQPTNHLAVYQSLLVSNPAAAGIYRTKHEAAIRAAQKQATG